MVAREMKDHVIVVGHTHLGARVVEYLRERRRPFVIIERDATAVDHLLRAGEAVIVDNAKETTTLEDAGVRHARTVIITSDNVETALLVTKRVRERNRDARIIVRCFQDDFAEILESLGASQVISTSRSAFEEIEGKIDPA
jgi:voltage-gated potassium channel